MDRARISLWKLWLFLIISNIWRYLLLKISLKYRTQEYPFSGHKPKFIKSTDTRTTPTEIMDSFLNWLQPVFLFCPVGWGCRIHRLLLCRGVRSPPTSVLDMTLNNLMVRFQQCWSFGEYGVSLHYHRSQVHSGPEW